MKVFIAALAHETNSFSPIPTSMQSYHDGVFYRPSECPEQDPETVFVGYGDFVRIAHTRNHQPILSLAAWAQPSAPTVQADYESIRDEILSDLKAAGSVDCILVLLHGAQMACGYEDCEGDLLKRMREIVGPDTPIGVELDLHCNISNIMVESATVIMACKEYPHTDFPERAKELYNIIEGTVKGETKPVMALHRAPMMSKFHTTCQPMRGFVDKALAMEGRNNILSITLAHGFSWSDIADTGSSVLVVTDNDLDQAHILAEKLAREFFELRTDVTDKFCSLERSLDRALAHDGTPVVLADSSDNAGGGAPGDSTFVLRAMIERRIENAALAMIWDPVAVQMAFIAGEGAEIALRIGGKMGPMSGDPVDVVARVTALKDNPTQRGLEPNRPEQLGKCAAIRVGGIDIVLNSLRQQVFSPDCFTALGIDPLAKKLLVVKSSQHFYAQFESLAATVIYCDAPGALNSNLSGNPYTNLSRPIWPLDNIEWPIGSAPVELKFS